MDSYDRLSVIWKSDLTDKIKRSFLEAVDTAIWMHYMDANLMYGEKAWQELHKNAAKILNKSCRQHPKKQQLYDHPSRKLSKLYEPDMRNKDELISDILLWTPLHGLANARRPARTYIQQLCANAGYNLKDLPGAKYDRDG